MAAAIPAVEPTEFTAGDTVTWTKDLADYLPTDGWSLSYAFRYQHGSGTTLDLTGASSNTNWTLTLSAAQSALMKPGPWVWAGFVTKATERFQVAGPGTITVKPNLAALTFDSDLRSSAKRAYDNALEAWEAVKLGQTVTINGRTYMQHDLDKLTRYVQTCKADYDAVLAKEQFGKTGINPRRIGVRFTRV